MSQTVVRSPNYPAISLGEAITKAKMIYEQESMHAADKEVIAKAMKYGGLNGTSYTIISALTKFGLLEHFGNQFKVSSDALDIILHRQGDIERVNAVRKLAYMPSLFQELHDQYPDDSPSDASLRAFLVKKEFSQKALGWVIRPYRDTIEFVKEETKGFIAESADETQEKSMQTQMPRHFGLVPNSATASVPRNDLPTSSPSGLGLGERVWSLDLSEDCSIRMVLTGRVTKEALDNLAEFIELSKKAVPSASSKQTSFEPETDRKENEE